MVANPDLKQFRIRISFKIEARIKTGFQTQIRTSIFIEIWF
jgi:hypothetical protein